MEYKQARFPVINQKLQDINFINICDNRTSKKPLIISDANEIQELTTALKEDIIRTDYESIMNRYSYDINITIYTLDENQKPINYALRNNYTSVINWLKEKGYYDRVILLPEEVDFVTLHYNSKTGENTYQEENTVEITDTSVIGELLSIDNNQLNYSDVDYVTAVFNINQYTFSISFPKDIKVSDSLRKYLDQLYQ